VERDRGATESCPSTSRGLQDISPFMHDPFPLLSPDLSFQRKAPAFGGPFKFAKVETVIRLRKISARENRKGALIKASGSVRFPVGSLVYCMYLHLYPRVSAENYNDILTATWYS
jgi:hypothetical protein